MKGNKRRQFKYIAFAVYIATVIWYTVLNRSARFQAPKFELFWSYREWLAGNWGMGWEILANIAMFMPFGFMLAGLSAGGRTARRAASRPVAALAAALFSLGIETVQLYFRRGMFEWDDVFSNTLGAVLGFLAYAAAEKLAAVTWRSKQVDRSGVGCEPGGAMTLGINIAFVLVCFGVFIFGRNLTRDVDDDFASFFCFQADSAEISGGETIINGFAFQYERPVAPAALILRQTDNGRRIRMKTEPCASPDVNEYFLCSRDYSNSGFTASAEGMDPTEEYEILVKWPFLPALSTGAYITGEDIHYSPECFFKKPDAAGTDLEEIVRMGTLRVYSPDFGCWVYQLGSSLYWIAGKDFFFEEDGTTYIQYQLYTTQTGRLPSKRLENNWLWDNIGGHFEKYELEGSFGEYRVMKRDLPREYSVKSVTTGYYAHDQWVWKSCFRPFYASDGLLSASA